MEKSAKFIIDVSAETKRIFNSSVRFFSKDHRTAKFLIQAEKDKVSIPKDSISRVEILFESVDISYTPTGKVIFNDDMTIEENGLFSYVLPDELLNYSGLMAFEVYIYYVNEDAADSSNRIIFEQRVSAIDRAAGAVELVYIKDMEQAKREITEQATEITENFLQEWNAFEAGSTAKMQELEQRIDEQTEIFNNADVYNKAEIEDKLEPFALQTDIAEVSAQLAQTATKAKKPTQIVRHRGWGYAVPENTLPAYEMSGKTGDKYVETDILPTSDGFWILHHDDTVDRMTDGTGLVSGLTLAQIKALNVDTSPFYPNLKVPTLSEFLDVVNKWGLIAFVEVKAISDFTLLDSLVATIKEKNMEHLIVIISFSAQTLQEVRNRNKLIELALVTYDVAGAIAPTLALGNAFINAYSSATETQIKQAHAVGLDVAIWGSNSQAEYEAYRNMGISHFTTDLVMEVR
ncbi:glycerophosphodiester phosphodiesterase family protein [Enterococcus dispar]|uniref:glycerophosphodiester phosphodiesterase family protein n=1 Tax=Enterococcus dispar TaxID=44009 RepID=UPI00288DA8BB|nr:glycerophosphodiester phosphodiesterase family protein [Enterococcus dispar]MDT2705755.1 glycerophosphodiester phosphodiesterase family protein [Enterococcus dispar]